ncbi:putative benzoate:H+ symporter BenE [Paenibacillus sp. V4I3]|uniref:benzoate/H(+) symporter BenE family transporter n=1 Tax=Paenibacillus sp. V4I3 TaxID=3042305 RepID=UPI00278B86D0|nr:benzoate/H(+) symporter BenE family transporter [Paenibacillus sp. V4I3]MDQ0874712.1 putative benzoate:H+ symporter BenE [Paenibacillus sp. V4I3]
MSALNTQNLSTGVMSALTVIDQFTLNELAGGFIIPAFMESPLIGGMAILGFFIAPKISKSIPPLLGVILFGVLGLFIGYDFPAVPEAAEFAIPQIIIPSFTVHSFFSIAIPIAVLILTNDIAVALAALKKNDYQPPVNQTLVLSGIGTLIAGFFGGHAVNIGGMMNTLYSETSETLVQRINPTEIVGIFLD